jgi:hypothetical protein
MNLNNDMVSTAMCDIWRQVWSAKEMMWTATRQWPYALGRRQSQWMVVVEQSSKRRTRGKGNQGGSGGGNDSQE